MKTVIQNYEVSEPGTHVAVIEYSDAARVAISFKDTRDLDSFKRAIDRVRPSQGRTASVNEALKLAREELFSPIGGGRPGIAKVVAFLHQPSRRFTFLITIFFIFSSYFKVLVVLTTNDEYDPLTDDTALRLREDGVGVFVVGLGSDLNPNALRNISGGSNLVYIVPNIRGLSTVIRNVISDMENGREGKNSTFRK